MDDIWRDLDAEFAIWRDEGLILPFWWRDDDAVDATPHLQRLVDLSEEVGVAVHLAVIPSLLQDRLVSYCGEYENLVPVTHGYAHLDHSVQGEKKCEFPAGRSETAVRAEVLDGHATMQQAFGNRFAPLFVPPWNRFAVTHKSILQDAGYKGFSTFTPRAAKWACGAVQQVNTHVDPIEWRGRRSVVDPAVLLDHVVAQLQDRRMGEADNAEPYGLLTHHLVHDVEIWAFVEAFLRRFVAGPVRLWTARELGKG